MKVGSLLSSRNIKDPRLLNYFLFNISMKIKQSYHLNREKEAQAGCMLDICYEMLDSEYKRFHNYTSSVPVKCLRFSVVGAGM